MVMKTTNVSRTVKANEARSPEFTGIQNTKRLQRNIAGNHTNVIEGLTNQSKEAEKSNTEPEVDEGKLTKKNNFRYSLRKLGQKSSISFSSHLLNREILHTAKNVIKILHRSCMSRNIL
jgi:hypothetical protein